MNKLLFLTMPLVCASAFAHDANTVAFYPFTDGTAGSSLDAQTTIANAVGSSYGGTFSTTTADAVKFSDEVPGQYVFDGEGEESFLCENPQSVHFDGTTKSSLNTGDQLITFAGLGSAVADADQDFTVEMFCRIPRAERGGGSPYPWFFGLDCGLVYNEGTTPLRMMFAGSYDQTAYAYVGAYNVAGTFISKSISKAAEGWDKTDTWSDGYWHHLACVYIASTKKLTFYIDYARVGDIVKEKQELSEVGNAFLGNGNYRGYVSCLRVSNCARATTAFLRCSNSRYYYPKTVFHFSFDGENGSTPATFEGHAENPFEGQYCGKTVLGNFATAVTYDTGSGILAPGITNEICKTRRTLVVSGDEVLAVSSNSVYLSVADGMGPSAAMSMGTGIKVTDQSHYPLTKGSFTMEGWFKLDWRAWKRKVVDAGVSYKRLTLMGQNYGNSGSACDFQMFLKYQDAGFALEFQANGGSGVTYKPAKFFMDDKWHHVAIVYDDSAYLFSGYIDRECIGTIQLSAAFKPRSSQDWRFYCFGYLLNNYPFEGLVDEIRMSRGVLSPSEFLDFKAPPSGLMLLLR